MTYACHNTETHSGYWARDQFIPGDDARSKPIDRFVWVHNRMSKDCRYDHKATDPKCEGCKK